jgi:hypothetical protein
VARQVEVVRLIHGEPDGNFFTNNGNTDSSSRSSVPNMCFILNPTVTKPLIGNQPRPLSPSITALIINTPPLVLVVASSSSTVASISDSPYKVRMGASSMQSPHMDKVPDRQPSATTCINHQRPGARGHASVMEGNILACIYEPHKSVFSARYS